MFFLNKRNVIFIVSETNVVTIQIVINLIQLYTYTLHKAYQYKSEIILFITFEIYEYKYIIAV